MQTDGLFPEDHFSFNSQRGADANIAMCGDGRQTSNRGTSDYSDRAVRLRALQRKAENRARCRGVIA
ncbi:hypothetical protein CN215_24295 [Sinorhizobium meliloti]|nr:hypothetical protein CN215_24295 [Sinorhizobium meliloti]